MHDTPSLLYIAGIPASSKSHFGKWLEANHGYLHIDAELPGQLDALGLHGLWDAALTRADARLLVDAVRDKGRTIILNWGFPPAFLPFITSLRSAGFSLWWFDSDISATRVAYCEAGRPPVSFEGQVAKITAAWPAIHQISSASSKLMGRAYRRLKYSASSAETSPDIDIDERPTSQIIRSGTQSARA